jgi:hypothetical protein
MSNSQFRQKQSKVLGETMKKVFLFANTVGYKGTNFKHCTAEFLENRYAIIRNISKKRQVNTLENI